MEDNNKPVQQNMEIELDGNYVNLALISHNEAEFVMDFVRMAPGMPKARVKARVVVTPQHAKRLLAALKENIAKWEATYGTMPESQNFTPSFGGPTAQA